MISESHQLTQVLTQSSEVQERREAARRLRDLGFAHRTSLEKRGSLMHSARGGLNEDELVSLRRALEDDDPVVLRDAVIASGDFGDADSLPALTRLCRSDDREIRLAAIDSLGDIGGEESTSVLAELAANSAEDAEIRLAALTELEELAAKQITSGPDRQFDPPYEQAGPSVDPDELGEAKSRLVEALVGIESARSQADELLRLKASDVRAYIESGVG